MEILFLGTGHAISTRCYNTCYVLRQNERYLLVDGGGGNGILRQLKRARLPCRKSRIFSSPTGTWTMCWGSSG